jgi:DNA-binding response OmpR family regulator
MRAPEKDLVKKMFIPGIPRIRFPSGTCTGMQPCNCHECFDFDAVKKILEKILVAEDDDVVRASIGEVLRRAGYRVLEAGNGEAALSLLKDEQPDLVILDVSMPQLGGLAALEIIRQRGQTLPVLMLSGHGEVDHRLRGLGLGADDYMAKPFDHRELLARVAALLRRGQPRGVNKPRWLRHKDISIDLIARHAERAGQPLPLTATEYSILEVLAQNSGEPISRERLLDLVWGYTFAPATRTVETHIWRLRKKLGDSADESGWIRNVQGAGYVLAASTDAAVEQSDVASLKE